MKRLLGQQTGLSLVELIVYMGLVSIVAGTAIPQLMARTLKTATVVENIVADIRMARGRAIVAGVRYCVHPVGSNRYEIRKLKQSGSTWVDDKVIKSVTLPSTVTWNMNTDSSAGHLEFNTRGMQVAGSASPYYTTINDVYGASHKLSIWPSGQVYEEY